MEKVSDKWFKDHGWKKYEDKFNDQSVYENTVRHSIQYILNTDDINARWDCIVYITPPGRYNRKKKVERFYMFWARNSKTNYVVENRITYWRPTTEQMEAALKVVGYKECEASDTTL